MGAKKEKDRRFSVAGMEAITIARTDGRRPQRGKMVVGRAPPSNFLDLPPGAATVDKFTEDLSRLIMLDQVVTRRRLRQAVIDAHWAGMSLLSELRKQTDKINVAWRSLKQLSELVSDPTFIPALLFAAPMVAAENKHWAKELGALVNALDSVCALEAIVADAKRRHERGARSNGSVRTNPGRPYHRGFALSLIYSWKELTGVMPSKTPSTKGNALRSRFHLFGEAALADVALSDSTLRVRELLDDLPARPPHINGKSEGVVQ